MSSISWAEKTESGSYALSFSCEDLSGFFACHSAYQNVQVDYYLDLSAFNGAVWLTTNVQDKNNFAFVSISSSGVVKQGRMINGEPKVFEQAKPMFLNLSLFALLSAEHIIAAMLTNRWWFTGTMMLPEQEVLGLI